MVSAKTHGPQSLKYLTFWLFTENALTPDLAMLNTALNMFPYFHTFPHPVSLVEAAVPASYLFSEFCFFSSVTPSSSQMCHCIILNHTQVFPLAKRNIRAMTFNHFIFCNMLLCTESSTQWLLNAD